MSKFYKAGPQGVPETLTKATSSFKRNVFLAMLALGAFILVYTGLMVWFGYRSVKLFDLGMNGGVSPFYSIVAAICLGLLSIFMFKSLFIFRSKREGQDRELKCEDEPELFDFIHKLADEVGAPRPYKIILTARVNASVFYDLSILNLLIPSKKNLEIGLGLINVLNLGELKAVLAHEFGHFAQRSMLLGRYVYTAQQIAERVVNKRDALDKLIQVISSIDLRIAWIGWIISILVWAIRALIEVLFSVVVYAERALSREMEFQADKVAVSVTGSDALIHALHKLRAADEGYRAGLDTINSLLNKKQAAPDLFALQTNYIEKTRWILDDPGFGKSPERSEKNGSTRIFKNRLVNPPEMWATHPADLDREENAKEVYLFAEIDERSAWDLFSNPEELRRNITAELISTAELKTELISEEESVRVMNEADYNWTFLNPKYKGTYLNRFSFINVKTSDEVYDSAPSIDVDKEISALYPEGLKDLLEKHKEVQEEIEQLTVVQHEVLTAERRVIMHRGDQIKRRQIPGIIKGLKAEEKELRRKLMQHDTLCRLVPYKIALGGKPEVAEYLKSISRLVHYSEHAIRNIDDIVRKFHNTLAVVTADGRVTDSEMIDLLKDCKNLGKALSPVYSQCKEIEVPKSIEAKLGSAYKDLFEEYKLGEADNQNINDWVNNVQGWVGLAQHCLYKLRNASLEHLLDTEEELLNAYRKNATASVSPEPITTIYEYKLLMPGDERKIQYKLGLWDRFIAGIGIVPTTAKFVASAGLILIAIWAGNVDDRYADGGYYDEYEDYYGSEVHLYNGFGDEMAVQIDGSTTIVQPNSEKVIHLGEGSHRIVTSNSEGDIVESFNAQVTNGYSDFIYNIGNSGYFVSYEIVYGENLPVSLDTDIENLGSPRFFESNDDYIMKDPPETIYSYATGMTRKNALMVLEDITPQEYPDIWTPDKDMETSILNHVLYDPVDDPNMIYWLALSSTIDPNCTYAKARLEANPLEVIFVRHLQDFLTDDARTELLEKYRLLGQENPDSPDLFYLNTRVIENEASQNRQFIAGNEKWSNHGWLAFAAGYCYANEEKWDDAIRCYSVALREIPTLQASIATDFERCIRMSDQRERLMADKFVFKNEQIENIRAIESGAFRSQDDFFDNAYYYLSQGKVTKAYNYARKFSKDTYMPFMWYIAASKGASSNMALSVMNTSVLETVHGGNVGLALAVLAKNDRDYEEVLSLFGQSKGFDEDDLALVRSFIAAVKAKQMGVAEGVLRKCTDFRQKINLRLVGVILSDGDCPEKWISMTNNMLFVGERPYIGE